MKRNWSTITLIVLAIGLLGYAVFLSYNYYAERDGLQYTSENFTVVIKAPIMVDFDGYGEALILRIEQRTYQLNKMGDSHYLFRPPNNTQVVAEFLPQGQIFTLGYVTNWAGKTRYYLIEDK